MEKEIKALLRKVPLHAIRLLIEKKVVSSTKDFEKFFYDQIIDQLKKRK